MSDDEKKAERLTGSREGGTDRPPNNGEGEDDGDAPAEGADDHLHEDQKPKFD